MDKTYCSKSIDKKCKYTECRRNLNGFYGMYVALADFNCEEELKGNNVYTKDINGDL